MAFPNIITRTGDSGQTALWCGTRVPKTDPRVGAVGEIDHALAALGRAHAGWNTPGGWLSAEAPDEERALAAEVRAGLLQLQRRYTLLMGEIATSAEAQADYRARHPAITEADSAAAEALYARIRAVLNARGERFRGWRIYGEAGPAAAEFYFARSCFRQAELAVWRLAEAGHPQRPELLQLLNRTSDLLFTIAVWLERDESAGATSATAAG